MPKYKVKYFDYGNYLSTHFVSLDLTQETSCTMASHGDEDLVPDETPGYQPPAQKSVVDIMSADADDESLKKYKESLLGPGGAVEVCKWH